MALSLFVKIVIILQAVTETFGVLDVTCFNNKPRIDTPSETNFFIGGYRSGVDTDASIAFRRASYTGTGYGLPDGSSERNHAFPDVVSARILDMPDSGVERIGAFYCHAQKGEDVENITTITLDKNSEIIPQFISQTVSTGESTTLAVSTSYTDLGWWHNDIAYDGIDGRPDWRSQKSVTIPTATVNDAGVYECTRNGRRTLGKHAIFQLVVRACSSGVWGDSCQFQCPVCYNGGICNERSGECVCAPGFSGLNCQTIHGYNYFGQDGLLVCARRNVDACRGNLFCLPHPYGCSCGAGYQGIGCDQDCDAGYYGASCRSTCHCNNGVPCSADTGICDGGQCHPDWYGDNCQVPCSVHQLVISNIRATPTAAHTLQVTWDPIVILCPRTISYRVKYKLTHLGQCFQPTNEPIQDLGSTLESQATIDMLEFYSTYAIYVSAVYIAQPDREGETVELLEKTEQAGPTSPPSNVNAYGVSANEISIGWTPPPCGSRNGPIQSYVYTFSDDDGNEVTDSIESENVTFVDLASSTDYTFEIAAMTEAGAGPSYTLQVSTKEAAPSAPHNFQVGDIAKTSMATSWQKPIYPNGLITKYTVQAAVLEKLYDSSFTYSISNPVIAVYEELDSQQTTYTFVNLKPSTKYELTVCATSAVGKGDPARIRQFTDSVTREDISSPPFLPPVTDSKKTSKTVEIVIPLSTSEFISSYLVGVRFISNKRKRQTADFDHYDKSPTSYVAAELSKSEVTDDPTFVVGDDQTHGSYYNPSLQEGQTYRLYTAFVSRINESYSVVSWSEGMSVTVPISDSRGADTNVVIIAVSVGIFAIMAIAIAGLVYKMRSLKKHKEATKTKSTSSTDKDSKVIAGTSGQIQLSTNGYAEYKPDEEDYEGIYEVYVNDSVMRPKKTVNDDDEYDEV